MSLPSVQAEPTNATNSEPLIQLDDGSDNNKTALEPKGGQHNGSIQDLNSQIATDQTNTSATSHRLRAEQYVNAVSLDKDGAGVGVQLGFGGIAQDHEERKHSIEKEASEHMAQRAAGIHIEDHIIADVKNELPQTPPPPEPPAKDVVGAKAPVPVSDEEFDEKHPPSEEQHRDFDSVKQSANEPTGMEIQTIMDQFERVTGVLGEQEIMSPRLEKQQPVLHLPPRSSSLELHKDQYISPQSTGQSIEQAFSPVPGSRAGSVSGLSLHNTQSGDGASLHSTKGAIFQPPPPSPEPEKELPFDFHRFLEQLRHRTADPVARYLRSFLNEFVKKQWAVHEQVKIISDFLEFIATKMGQCEIWRTVSEAEFDNAREGMEKLVMNRLYSQTFSPAIAPSESPRKRAKNGRFNMDAASPIGPGRRGQHQEDVERDDVIAQKLRIYGWVSEDHLDIKPLGEKGRKFLLLAQQELLKINTYRAPRDKVICVLNCCKVIFGFLKNSKSDQSADAFVPLMIYTVLRAKPEYLVSNVQYIWRFRNQEKLDGEAGYYMSSLMGVVTFVENLDRTNLTITDEEFERKVEQAVSAIAERDKQQEYEEKIHISQQRANAPGTQAVASSGPMHHLSEKGALCRPEVTPRNSMDAERSSPRKNATQRLNEKNTQASASQATNGDDDSDAVSGLLRTIQKPLSSIGRIFSDDSSEPLAQRPSRSPARTPLPGSTPRGLSPGPLAHQGPSADGRYPNESESLRQRLSAEDAAARQASAEVEQARKMRFQEHKVVSETLQGMFPNLDKDVIEDVVRAQEGNVGKAVDACLAMSG
ncbi:hypothetical protein K431DRAFT_244275 [Polychaeton citri CBS 116435]|uniref:Guanine nucleotide exchange factor Vps9 n=1 Tax=Polychaeton citri CBS 116435 TaxID=1314669 RepID=A0A9P4QB64_9PEZI|nr:hypothetical protein K431DRAFT_244275 [Polychaeton citri CBS 116435]